MGGFYARVRAKAIDENGGGPGVRLNKRPKKKKGITEITKRTQFA